MSTHVSESCSFRGDSTHDAIGSASHGPHVCGHRQQREVLPIQGIPQVKNSRKTGASVNRLLTHTRARGFVPAAIGTLPLEKPAHALGDGVRAVVTGRK